MKEAPKGMYIFPSGFLSANNLAVTSAGTAISNANCDGVRWLLRWSDVEATPDTYTWQYLDDAVAWAAANGKKCGISINAGRDCPTWLYAAPYKAQPYTLQDTPGEIGRRIPVPGDPVFMARWQKFITAFGARYDSNPTVSFVIICGIGNHDEWDLASGTLDTAALGSTLAEVDAWKSSSKQIIDFYMSAFPNTTVMGLPEPPFNPSNAAEDPLTSMREVSDYAANTYNCHFAYSFPAFQSSTTTSNSPSANELFLHWVTNPTHGETLSSYSASSADDFDATLHVAIDLKVRGMEIYKVDFENPALQDFIVSSGTYAGKEGGITPRRADMLTIPTPTPCSVQLTAAASRKIHGSAGTFDVNLPLSGTLGVECRSSAGNYTLVFTFLNNLTSVASVSVSSGTGSVNSTVLGPNASLNLTANQYQVNLTGVSNQQYITVTLHTVQDSAGNTGDVVGPQMGVLIGDVDASGRVDSTDVFQVRQQTLQNANSSNFRADVDASGRIDSTDVFITRQQTLTSLPSPSGSATSPIAAPTTPASVDSRVSKPSTSKSKPRTAVWN
jgi:hypothetical protein